MVAGSLTECEACAGATASLGDDSTPCIAHETCSGIEFKEGFADGTNECIMVRTMDTHEQVHAAAGWTIYARPEIGNAIFVGGGGGH